MATNAQQSLRSAHGGAHQSRPLIPYSKKETAEAASVRTVSGISRIGDLQVMAHLRALPLLVGSLRMNRERRLVDGARIELATSALRTRRSPS